MDPLFLLFVALSVGVVAAGWVVVGKLMDRRPADLVEVQVSRPQAVNDLEFEAARASAPMDVPAPITRMARVDVAEMHAEIEQFLREQSR